MHTRHQAEDARKRVSHPPCYGCLKFWRSDICGCKKLRKFDDAELERQFVQHNYHPPIYFWFITVVALGIAFAGGWFAYQVSEGNDYPSSISG